jgi:glycosyltransferase involved in cell wall biosynthesis
MKFRHKCKVIPYGHKLPELKPNQEVTDKIAAIRRVFGPEILLFVGKFRNYKGLHILFDAMKGIDGKLLVIGSGTLRRNLLEFRDAARMNKKIFFLGELEDPELVHYLHACDILILPSNLRSEAFGIIQLEAMACGKPVVSTELGTGTSFVNRNQETGLVVGPNDAEALTRAVNYLIEHPEIRRKYGAAGIERAEKYFSVEKMVDSIVSVYRDVLILGLNSNSGSF